MNKCVSLVQIGNAHLLSSTGHLKDITIQDKNRRLKILCTFLFLPLRERIRNNELVSTPSKKICCPFLFVQSDLLY